MAATVPLLKKDASDGTNGTSDGTHSFCSKIFQCSFLMSGRSAKDQDAFKPDKMGFHEFGHDIRMESTHGSKMGKMLDEAGALLLFAPGLLWTTSSVGNCFLKFVVQLWHRELDSMALVMFANTIIELVIVLGAFLMWVTLCYWSDRVHSFWKIKVWPLPSLMPGGFLPRMAAFSLGVLMFTTSTLVSEGRVKGSDLASKFHSDHWQYCRATDMAAEHASWYGRILTRPTIVSEGYHCLRAEFKTWFGYTTGIAGVLPFDSSYVEPFFDENDVLNDTLHTEGVGRPVNNGTVMPASIGFPMDKLVQWGIADKSHFNEYNFQCMYQCSKWKTVGLIAVIKNAGTIVAGSAVVVKTSDMISKRFGGWLFGLPLITADSLPKTILKVAEKTRVLPGKGRSKLVAAFTCLLAMTPLRFASKIDSDGYYTVDYYVTAVFFSSLVMALVVRQWNPYRMSRIAYTEELWSNGEDIFVDFKQHTHRKINLYEWVHLTHQDRENHLLGYARKVTKQTIDDESNSQKEIERLAKLARGPAQADPALAPAPAPAPAKAMDPKKALEELNKMLDGATKNVKKNISGNYDKDEHEALVFHTMSNFLSKGTDSNNQYFNPHANLIVKTIQDISVVIVSPPLTEEKAAKTKFAQGITVFKYLVLKRGSVGTLLEKVDAERIKVRFPKRCPDNAPTHEKGKGGSGQYTITLEPKMPDEHLKEVDNWIRDGHDDVFVRAGHALGGNKKCEGDYEDVVVTLEQIMEASQEWVDIQDKADHWKEVDQQGWTENFEEEKEKEKAQELQTPEAAGSSGKARKKASKAQKLPK